MSVVVYQPPPSVQGFLQSEAFSALIVGPVGSTKTTGGLMKIAYHAKRMAPCKDGKRRSRCVWVRNTNQQLYDTSIPDFLKWFPDGAAGVFERSKSRFILQFDDVECEVLFRGLDDANDVRRLLSLQLSFAVLDEFREIHPDIYHALQGRLGRYPDKMMVPPRPQWGADDKGHPVGGCVTDDGKPNAHLWGMSNPPDMDTFWEQLLSDPPKNTAVFFQPSGLSAEADWLQYLPADYYENLMEGKSQDWVDVYVHAKFGKSLSGQPVFSSFSKAAHVAETSLSVLPSPVIIGADAGLTPAATVCQLDYQGRLLVLDSLNGESMGALRFVREKLKPLIATKYAGRQCIVVLDPAAMARAPTDERTVADIYRNEGFKVIPARTNSITARLASVEAFLNRQVDGRSGLLIDPACTLLIEAMRSRYRYKINNKGERNEEPDKSHPWSDLCFTAGTPVLTPDGYVRIERLRVGDIVAVADGVDTVVATGSRFVPAAGLVTLTLSDGTQLTCTRDHPFAVGDKSRPYFVPADALGVGDAVVGVEDGVWINGLNLTRRSGLFVVFVPRVAQSLKRLSGRLIKARGVIAQWGATAKAVVLTMASRWTVFGFPGLVKTATTGTNAQTSAVSPFTDTFGKNITARSQKGFMSTIKTATQQTTPSKTLNCSLPLSMRGSTSTSASRQGSWMLWLRWGLLEKLRKVGTLLKKGGSGTGSRRSRQSLTVVRKDYPLDGQYVFNLTTSRTHTYYAGPALVHNCDSLQYACLHADNGASIGARALTVARKEIKSVSYVYV